MDSEKNSWEFQEIENFNTIETETIPTNTEAESISLKSKGFENMACFRIEKYADELIPTSNIETATKIVTAAVPTNFKIVAIDFTTSFPALVSIQKFSDKPWLWNIHIGNLHGRHRPKGFFEIDVFAIENT